MELSQWWDSQKSQFNVGIVLLNKLYQFQTQFFKKLEYAFRNSFKKSEIFRKFLGSHIQKIAIFEENFLKIIIFSFFLAQ